MSMTYDELQTVLQAAVAKANEMDVKLGFAIVDASGNLMAAVRMSSGGMPWLLEVVRGKATATVAWGGQASSALSERASNSPIFNKVNDFYGGKLVYLGGAVPLKRGDELIGAIAGGGASPQQDEEAAAAGAAALAG